MQNSERMILATQVVKSENSIQHLSKQVHFAFKWEIKENVHLRTFPNFVFAEDRRKGKVAIT